MNLPVAPDHEASDKSHTEGGVAMSTANPTLHTTKPRKRHRIFMWVFLAVQLLFVIWVITGIASGSSNTSDAENVGTALGVGIIVLFWFFVDAFLGIAYAVYRLARKND